tara:strand:+ start:16380 stop:17210 length:831 start_codon:yes stop_codon:yes gene_type:complete
MGNSSSNNTGDARYDLSKTPKSIFGLKGNLDEYDASEKMTCSDLSMFNSRYRTLVYDAKKDYDKSDANSSKRTLDRKVRNETEEMFNEDFDMGRRNSNEGTFSSDKRNVGSNQKNYCIGGDLEKKGMECTDNDECKHDYLASTGICTSSLGDNDERSSTKRRNRAKNAMTKKYASNDTPTSDQVKPGLKEISERPPSYNNDKLEVLAMFDLCNRAKDAGGNCLATVDEVKWTYAENGETDEATKNATSTHVIPGGFKCVTQNATGGVEDWGTAGEA